MLLYGWGSSDSVMWPCSLELANSKKVVPLAFQLGVFTLQKLGTLQGSEGKQWQFSVVDSVLRTVTGSEKDCSFGPGLPYKASRRGENGSAWRTMMGGSFCNDWGRKASSQGWFVCRSPETGGMCYCRSILKCEVREAGCRRWEGGWAWPKTGTILFLEAGFHCSS